VFTGKKVVMDSPHEEKSADCCRGGEGEGVLSLGRKKRKGGAVWREGGGG